MENTNKSKEANWMYCVNEGRTSHFEYRPETDTHQADYKCAVCGSLRIN